MNTNDTEKLNDKDLNQVSGGCGPANNLPDLFCEKCGTKMTPNAVPFGPFTRYTCPKCGHYEDI